jgi:hypothetical protein
MQKIEMIRLIADEGKILVNGKTTAQCVDVFAANTENWTEVDAADKEPEAE